MRILFAAAPGYGLMLPVIPMAWAALSAGHDVLVATTAHMTKVAAECGLLVVDVFPNRDVGEDLVSTSTINEVDGVSDLYKRLAREVRPFELFALAMTAGTISAARDFKADLIVHSPDHIAGRLTASALNLPLLELGNRISWSPRDHGFMELARANPRMGIQEETSEVVASIRRKLRISTKAPEVVARIDPRPPAFGGLQTSEVDLSGTTWLPMRYVPFNGGGLVHNWSPPSPQKPRVCLTLGTVAPLLPGGVTVEKFLSILGTLPVEIVLADSESDLSQLTLPPNLLTAEYIPLNSILANCSIIVHHGGSGTTAAALDRGVPQLVVAQGADNEICAQKVANAGVGLSLSASEVTTERIVSSVDRILNSPRFRIASREVAEEMAAQPSPSKTLETVLFLHNSSSNRTAAT